MVGRSGPSHESQEELVEQLLRDWGGQFQRGMQTAYVETTDDNVPSSVHLERQFEFDEQAENFAKLEAAINKLEARKPRLVGNLKDIYMRSVAGNSDIDILREKAKRAEELDAQVDRAISRQRDIDVVFAVWEKASAARKAVHMVRLHDWARDCLVYELKAQNQELHAIFARQRTSAEEKDNEAYNRNIYIRHKEMAAEGKEPYDIYYQLWVHTGLSRSRLQAIVTLQRERHGEPKRGRGRPKKAS